MRLPTRRLSGWFFCLLTLTASVSPADEAPECHVRSGLPNVAAKLEQGKTVRIAYLGGSITCQNGYRVKSLDWFRSQYPNASVEEIFAGIGGTPSKLGVYRLGQDVLGHKPDLLFVEFAVNDSGQGDEECVRSIEGIVRQTWAADPTTDIIFVYTLTRNMFPDLQAGRYPSAARSHEKVAALYGVPTIHMGVEAARLEADGELVIQGDRPPAEPDPMTVRPIVFSGDGVHPYENTGHALYMRSLARWLPECLAAGTPGPHGMPAPLNEKNRERATIVPLAEDMLTDDWRKLPDDHPMAKRFARYMPELWMAETPGATLRIEFTGTAIGLYDLLGPDCGQVRIRLDDSPVVIRPRIDGYCTYARIAWLTIGDDLDDGPHVAEVEIDGNLPDKMDILFERNRARMKGSPDLEKTRWYVGGILIEGEIIP